MRCKVKLTRLTKLEGGGYEAVYVPVSSGSPENNSFFKYTPYGEIKLGIMNEDAVRGQEPGQELYLDFNKAM